MDATTRKCVNRSRLSHRQTPHHNTHRQKMCAIRIQNISYSSKLCVSQFKRPPSSMPPQSCKEPNLSLNIKTTPGPPIRIGRAQCRWYGWIRLSIKCVGFGGIVQQTTHVGDMVRRVGISFTHRRIMRQSVRLRAPNQIIIIKYVWASNAFECPAGQYICVFFYIR